MRWANCGGIVLPPAARCTWIEVEDVRITSLMTAVAMHLAKAGECPGHAAVDPNAMHDSYRAADLPRGNNQQADELRRLLEDEHA